MSCLFITVGIRVSVICQFLYIECTPQAVTIPVLQIYLTFDFASD